MSATLSPAPTRLQIGALLVDTHYRRAMADGAILPLTPAQYAVLETLMLARGAIVSREALCQVALHRGVNQRKRGGVNQDRSVDQVVFLLRKLLPLDRDGLPLIRAVRIAGYWMPAAGEAV